MRLITQKKELAGITGRIVLAGGDNMAKRFLEEILSHKVRFPLLEYTAQIIFDSVPYTKQLPFTDKIIAGHTIGGNVIAGKILQLRLENDFDRCFDKALDYIFEGNEWYCCDIIAERVMGYALLTHPEKTLPKLKKLAKHKTNWAVRTVGVATHYATKKGLQKKFGEEMFLLLHSLSSASDLHIKTGTGWGAKTIAKFHPGIIEKHQEKMEEPEVRQWFKTKVRIGLGRAYKYAAKYNR